MYYEKNQYSQKISVLAIIIAGLFLLWGISSYFPYSADSWWGLIPLGIGGTILMGQLIAVYNRSKLRRIVRYEFEDDPKVTIEDITLKTGISPKDVRAIKSDLLKVGEYIGRDNIVIEK